MIVILQNMFYDQKEINENSVTERFMENAEVFQN